MSDEYETHKAQLRCTHEVWADRFGLQGKARQVYLEAHFCGGWIVSDFDTFVRCKRCPDERDGDDY